MIDLRLQIVPDWAVQFAVQFGLERPLDSRYKAHGSFEPISSVARCCDKPFGLRSADIANRVIIGQCPKCGTIHYTEPVRSAAHG